MADYISTDPNAGVDQKQYLSTDPNFGLETTTPSVGEIAQYAGTAAVETAKGFIPKSLGEALGFVTPVVGAVEDVGRGYGMLKDVLFGKPINEATAQAFPETQIIPQAEQTAPYSEERFQAGFGALAQLGMAALGVKGLFKTLSPEALPQIPETPISDAVIQQPAIGGIDAIQEKSTSSVLQHTQETGGQRERVEPSVQGQETPQASTQEVTLYHSTPKKFEAFTGTGTPTGLGGKAFYFSDKPEPAYGENVVPVWIPKDKILDISKPDIPFKNDAEIRKAGYEGTFNPQTREYTVYDPNQFIKKPQEVTPAVPQPEQPIEAGARPVSRGDLVKFTEPSIVYKDGNPITIQSKRAGHVSFIRPDGKIEVKAQDGSYRVFTPEELGYKGGEKSEEIQRQNREAVVSPARSDAEGLRASVSGETGQVGDASKRARAATAVQDLAKAPESATAPMPSALGGAVGARRVGKGWEPIIEQAKQEMRDAINKQDYATPAKRADAIDAARNKIQELQAQAHSGQPPDTGSKPVQPLSGDGKKITTSGEQPTKLGASSPSQNPIAANTETGGAPVSPVSEPAETATAQPLTQDSGVETPPTVSETTPKGQAETAKQPVTYPEGEGRTTGIAQRITNVPSNEGLTVQESVDRGQNLLSEGVNPEEVSARVKTTKQLSVDDLSVLRARTSELDKAAYAAEDAMRANPNDPIARKNWEDAVRARNDWNTDHVKPAQTIWSDLGRTQQGEADIDTGTVTGLRVAFNEAKGRDPTLAEQSKLTDYADKTQNVESQIDQAKDKYDQAIAKEFGSGGVPTTEALQEHFLSKITDPNAKSYPFTQGEIADLWKYTKSNYIDKGVTSLDDTIHMVSLDTGLRPEWVADALTKHKAIKSVTNELYSVMSKRRDIVNAAKDYIRAKDEPLWKRVAKAVWETPFSLAIYGHGTVGGITHAGANIFRPSVWSSYWPDFVNQAKFFAKPGIHEAAMQRLVREKNFITAKRAGLANDPNLTYTDYGAYAKFFGLQGGRRGFDALKTMRQSMFDSQWSKVPESIKSDAQASKELSKGYADMINHATGVISNTDRGFLGTSSRALSPLMFAAKLEASRWARVIGDPVKTLDTYAQWGKASPAEKAIAIQRTKNAAEFAAGFLGTLYLNQAILSASGSKDKINFTDPSKSDWLKHKIAGHTVAVDGGLLSPIRLLGRLTYDTLIRPRKELRGDTRTSAAIKDVGQYAIGKASPSVSIAKEAVTGESFDGRLLPWSRDTSKKPRMTWPEYASSHGPIPISGGIKDAYDSMRQRGMSKPDAEAVLRGLAAFGSELTGARVMEIQEPTPKLSKNRPR